MTRHPAHGDELDGFRSPSHWPTGWPTDARLPFFCADRAGLVVASFRELEAATAWAELADLKVWNTNGPRRGLEGTDLVAAETTAPATPIAFDDLDDSHTERQWVEAVRREQRRRRGE